MGGGALLFELLPKKAVINDFNKELINVYKILASSKENITTLIKKLNLHEKNNNENYYYKTRNIDRDIEAFSKLSNMEKATRMIYLNKACFNGMYRVNSKNQFNVPFNKKNNLKTYEKANLLLINKYFNNNDVTILNDDFEKAVKTAKKGDFVYFDPPYDTLNDSFTSYTKNGFCREEQKRLFLCYRRLDEKGVYVMLSNHNTPFINQLYKDYKITIINANRNINSNGKKRGPVEETIITNY